MEDCRRTVKSVELRPSYFQPSESPGGMRSSFMSGVRVPAYILTCHRACWDSECLSKCKFWIEVKGSISETLSLNVLSNISDH